MYKPVGEAEDKLELIVDSYQMNSFIDRVLNPECKFKIGIDSCLANYIFKSGTKLTEAQKMTIDSCEASRMSGYISPSFQLVPCSFADYNAHGVNLHNKDIESIWNKSLKFKKFRSMLKNNPHNCPIGF